MKVSPFILGSGRAGRAAEQALVSLAILEPELGILPAARVTRGAELGALARGAENPVLIISNPHGLHSESILKAEQAGFRCILTEKPSCVSQDEARSLQKVKVPTGVFHVYRQMWGVQTLKTMLADQALGSVIAVEGRYWQSSAAERAIADLSLATKSWKNDISLSGPSDALLDLGTHWIDAVTFLLGTLPSRTDGWISHANSESAHRDTHVQLALEFSENCRALGSISKTAHGATNQFELTILGTRMSAAWNFLNPDEIVLGEGKSRQVLTRQESLLGSKLAPFHAMGWLEGYIEILRQVLRETFLGVPGNYPRLSENSRLMECLFSSDLWHRTVQH